MLFESKKILRKIDGGAVLMQTLLGLAIMIAMTPLILGQIRKYNESIHREEVVAQLKLLQKAVTSYIAFDRTQIAEGCTLYDIAGIKDKLKDYGGEKIVSPNQFGQNYYFVTCKEVFQGANAEMKQEEDSRIDAVVFASGGGVDDITLNSIGEYLFDQGAVLSTNTHDLLANYEVKLNEALKTEIVKKIGNEGALLMFVSDAFQVSDYLYRTTGPGGSTVVNTMLTDINMLGHNLLNVGSAQGTQLEIRKDLKVSGVAGKELRIMESEFTGAIPTFSIENFEPFEMGLSNNIIPISAENINVTSLEVDDATFERVDLPIGELKTKTLETETLNVEGDVSIVPNTNNWEFGAKEVTASTINSKGTTANVFDKVALNRYVNGNEKASFIYWGKVDSNGNFDSYDSGVLNLSGVSEVTDICWFKGAGEGGGSSCLSENVNSIYQRIRTAWNNYNTKFSTSSN